MTSNNEHFVAPVEETPLLATDAVKTDQAPPLSLWLMPGASFAAAPPVHRLLAADPAPGYCCRVPGGAVHQRRTQQRLPVGQLRGSPTAGHPLGFTLQGCDVYSRVIHGTQASLSVGVLSVLAVVIIGVTLGALAGYYGGWLDSVLARLGDIFFALPIILGALVITQLPLFRENRSVWTVVLTISLLAWPQMARITRGAVIEVRNADFVTAARSLGVSKFGALVKHALPNAWHP